MKIFVFGSNLKGIHGLGAALTAFQKYGAMWRVGEGRTGMAYAIPTKTGPRQKRPLMDVCKSVKTFIGYARDHPELSFFVTRVGCGYAGFTDTQMAPLFAGAPDNCRFDPLWAHFGLLTWQADQLDANDSFQNPVNSMHKEK